MVIKNIAILLIIIIILIYHLESYIKMQWIVCILNSVLNIFGVWYVAHLP